MLGTHPDEHGGDMTTPTGRRRRSTGAALALVAALGLVLAPPAAAHDSLVASDPTADAVLGSAPSDVSLTFSGDLLDVGATVMVVDSAGTDHAGAPVVDGPRLTTPLGALPDGSYTVRWRVVSSDGHPISGLIPFVVGSPSTTPPAAAVPAPDASGTPDAAPGAPGAPEASGLPAAVRPLAVGGLGALAGVTLLVLVRVAAAPRRRTPAAPHVTETP